MSNSVHSNASAQIALQNLNQISERLASTQNRISTGLKVQGAKDNSAIWAIAQNQRADLGALESVKSSLDRATSLADVTLAAGESISDLIIQMRQKAVAASDPSQTAESRAAYNDDFQALVRSVQQFATSASFDGVNLLDNSEAGPLAFLANVDAMDTISIDPQNMTTAGLGLASLNLLIEADAATALTAIDAALTTVNSALASLGSQAKQLETHNIFVSKLMDALETGIGKLVDADLAKESARLQALQVQQQLGAQSLSLANQAPQIILSLFRSEAGRRTPAGPIWMAAGRRRDPFREPRPYSESNDFKALTKAVLTASSSSGASITDTEDHCSLSRGGSRPRAWR
jgi:flagellin